MVLADACFNITHSSFKENFEDILNESKKLGFNKAELMATISGILLYQDRGYEVDEEIEYESKQGNKVPMYKMEKILNG